MIITRDNREDAEKVATKKLQQMIDKIKVEQGTCKVGLCGGRSVEGIFEKLDLGGCTVGCTDESDGRNQELIKKYFPCEGLLSDYDVALLSSGEDGHIASLFPDHETFYDEDDEITSTKSAPKHPAERKSISRRHVLGLKGAVVVFFGEEKQDALKHFLDRTTQAKECPARIMKNIKEWYAITDVEE